MKKELISIIAAIILATSGFCGDGFDFDGKSNITISNILQKADVSVPLLYQGIISKTNIELENKEIEQKNKGEYSFMPNQLSGWEFECNNQSNPQAKWGFCWSVTFVPSEAGHNHESSTLLSYIDPQNPPNLLPTQICKSNIPVNTPYTIRFRTPYYSTLVLEKTEFYGSCNGTINDKVQITVEANKTIKLYELMEEPYFTFKESDGHHPKNHFATLDTITKFKKIAWEYYNIYKPTDSEALVKVNDIGLPWGGRYNTYPPYNCWIDGGEHFYHRYGRQIDIRSWNIPKENRKCFEEIACKYGAQPILEGKAPGTLNIRNYGNISLMEADALDRTEHYHLNFWTPSDPTVTPSDDHRKVCPDNPPVPSYCPSPKAQ